MKNCVTFRCENTSCKSRCLSGLLRPLILLTLRMHHRIQGDRYLRPGRQQIIRLGTVTGRIISLLFFDKRTYLFLPPFSPSTSEFLTIVARSWLGRKCPLGGFLVLFVHQFCGPSKNGHEFGLMVDGDER